MHATIATLSAALCGLTALSLVGCDAHTLTARLPGANSASSGPSPAPGAAPADTGRATATMHSAPPPDPGLYSHQSPSDPADDAARERAREKGCNEPGGCYYGVRLVGYPIEEAKRRATEFGFTGEIDVDGSRQYSECQRATVCEIQPANWPTYGDTLTLYVRYAPHELKINKPE